VSLQLHAKRTAEAPPTEAKPAETKIETTVQVLTVEPGLYSVGLAASEVVRGKSGLIMPCIRLDPIRPGSADMGIAHVAALSDDSLLTPNQAAAYLRVQGGDATVLLTIYRLGSAMKAPELRITRVQPDATPSLAAPPEPKLFSESLTLMAHIERVGDVSSEGGIWVGYAGAGGAVEGFAVTPSGPLAPSDIEYQAVLGADWTTPWLPGGEFCGSRGLSLALLGVRIRLVGEAAKTYSCRIWGRFIGAGEAGPFADGEVCVNNHAPLEGLRVVIVKRDQARQRHKSPQAAPPPATATAPNTRSAARPFQEHAAKRAAPAKRPGKQKPLPKPIVKAPKPHRGRTTNHTA